MEEEMQRCGIRTSFIIARAAFYPVNITFARAGYRFGGTLVNNTNICGAFDSRQASKNNLKNGKNKSNMWGGIPT